MLNQNVNEIQTVEQQTSWLVPTALLSPVAISIQFLEGFPILFFRRLFRNNTTSVVTQAASSPSKCPSCGCL